MTKMLINIIISSSTKVFRHDILQKISHYVHIFQNIKICENKERKMSKSIQIIIYKNNVFIQVLRRFINDNYMYFILWF